MRDRLLLCPFLIAVAIGLCDPLYSQTAESAPIDSVLPQITLKDALARAARYGGQIQSAALAARLAHEDSVQAKAGLLPTVSALNQFIYTQGNGTASGVFVANDGVHVYNEQAVLHQDLFSAYRRAELRRAQAVEAIAMAKREVTARGLNTTVVQDFYGAVIAARKRTNAQTSLADANRFLDITRKQERGGEAAKADVIKAQLLQQQRERDVSDAQATLEKSKIALAVLILPDITQDFVPVDDLDNAPPLADAAAVESQAAANSPELRVAQSGILQSRQEVAIARDAYLPSLALDFFYGIDANQFAARTDYATPESGRSTLPDYLVVGRHNLGYSGQVTLNIPVWNWGITRSKVKQAQMRQEQAESDLTVAEKQLRANIRSSYLEAHTSQAQIASLLDSETLSAESLRLTLLRYQAGEATVLEVVDAQTAIAGARNAYADGLARYRLALATIQALTGRF